MYCTHCGRQVESEARFCSACGAAGGAAQAVPRPLLRPRDGRFIAGVCAAFANEYGKDVALVRILTAGLMLCSGGLIALIYFIAWIVIPEAPYGLAAPSSGSIA